MENHFMTEPINIDYGTKAGTVGGTLLTIVCNIHIADLTKTAVLAAVGAVVSFAVSISLRWLIRKFKR
jgi:hypothetical protein